MACEEFTLADGTHKRYPVGEVFFEFGGKAGTSKVVFTPRGMTPLLGALTLESLGLMVNPITRELAPMRMILGEAAAAFALAAARRWPSRKWHDGVRNPRLRFAADGHRDCSLSAPGVSAHSGRI